MSKSSLKKQDLEQMQRGKRGEEMGASIKPNKKKMKQAQRNKYSLFDMILDLLVIKFVCMSLLV
jgi:hypothetical protein